MSTKKYKVDDHSDLIWTIPNVITFFRFIFIIVAIVLGTNNKWAWAALFIFLAAISDYFDGDIARRYKWKSKLGAALDPIADKFFMAILLAINSLLGLIVIGLEAGSVFFSNSVRKKYGGHFIAPGSKAITFIQMSLAIVLVLMRISGLDFLQIFEAKIYFSLVALSLSRLLIYFFYHLEK